MLELWALTQSTKCIMAFVIFGADTRRKSRITNKVCDIREHFFLFVCYPLLKGRSSTLQLFRKKNGFLKYKIYSPKHKFPHF